MMSSIGDRHLHLRYRSRFEPPPSKRVGRNLIEKLITRTFTEAHRRDSPPPPSKVKVRKRGGICDKGGLNGCCVSAIDSNGRTIWIVDAHRDGNHRFIVQTKEKLDAILNKWRAEREKKKVMVTEQEIAEVISSRTGIPVSSLR